MRGRYFCISFLITLLVIPAFAYGQSKTEGSDPAVIEENETTEKLPIPQGTSGSNISSRQFIPREHAAGQDGIAVLKLAGMGFLNQFTNRDTLLLLGAAGGMTYLLSLDEVNQQEGIQRANVIGRSGQNISDIAGLMLNIPILQIGGYYWGRATHNEKLVQFSMDVLATHIITLLEVGAISQISFHQRPNVAKGIEAEERGGINNVFRGVSSFPSGHIVGASVFMFKGWEYYGWKAGMPATVATVLIGWARIEAGDHYLTDILGTVALSGIASLATSKKFDMINKGILTSGGQRVMVMPMIGTSQLGVSVTGSF